MIVNDGSGLVEFESVEIPFNLNDERMGQVSGKLKAWKIKNFPDSAPCMIVSNMGSEWRIP